METFLIRALQLILSLSILVVLHELGHFAFARLFKVRVDKFYMFFNPNFSLIRAKKINGKWDIKIFAANVPANERPKLDADGDVMVDSKKKTIMEQIPASELPEGDWRKYPDNTEWVLDGYHWVDIVKLQEWWTNRWMLPKWLPKRNHGNIVHVRFGTVYQLLLEVCW